MSAPRVAYSESAPLERDDQDDFVMQRHKREYEGSLEYDRSWSEERKLVK